MTWFFWPKSTPTHTSTSWKTYQVLRAIKTKCNAVEGMLFLSNLSVSFRMNSNYKLYLIFVFCLKILRLQIIWRRSFKFPRLNRYLKFFKHSMDPSRTWGPQMVRGSKYDSVNSWGWGPWVTCINNGVSPGFLHLCGEPWKYFTKAPGTFANYTILKSLKGIALDQFAM